MEELLCKVSESSFLLLCCVQVMDSLKTLSYVPPLTCSFYDGLLSSLSNNTHMHTIIYYTLLFATVGQLQFLGLITEESSGC